MSDMWTPKNLQTEDEWFQDYLKLALREVPAASPSTFQSVAGCDTTWFPMGDGAAAFIEVTGGKTPDDRLLARSIVAQQLVGQGYRQAAFTIVGDWDEVQAKAKRLKDAGNVTVLRNGAQNIVGSVIGDHGTYQTEISRDDPNSQAITGWQCDCPWDQYAWQRTRQWKKYEGRPCAHVLALYWASKSLPVDEEFSPGAQQPQGQPSLFNTPPGQAAPPVSPFQAPGGPPPQQGQIPGVQPGTATGTPPLPSTTQVPQPADVLPQWINPADAPQVNPASVPGLRQPSPTNPTQYPGGTFSSWQFDGEPAMLSVVSADFNQQGEGFANGNIVSTKHDDWGTWQGKSTDHGAGSPAKIPAGAVGEVLGQDPTGLVNVLFMGPSLTANHGPMMPYGATAWFFANELHQRPDIQRPGPAIKRRT